ncbi:MAG TPA: phytanoyl-CoA dioxygenase family protein [Hyphomicrobiaceae bacterium]|nr:phytanoyl-CoA dioxygenase family protein [Hyphomicrobiaceae bacterium]
MLTPEQVDFYNEHGYVMVPDVLSPREVDELRRTVEGIVAGAASVTSHTDVYDLEDGHTAAQPKVRRIKTPHKHFDYFKRLVRHQKITSALAALLGPNIRLHGSKLNMKSAGYGAPVEWHQDWAFYPHTNDDVTATGILLDDCKEENGPLLVIPGSHRGRTYDHHSDGAFCGAITGELNQIDFSKAVPLTGKAGSMSIHHARLLHGSAQNTSDKQRRLLLFEYTAADAWPLLGVTNFQEFNERMVLGEPTVAPRIQPVPVRMPFPPASSQGSIYENQRGAKVKYFGTQKVA